MGEVAVVLAIVAVASYGAFWLMMLFEIGARPDWVYEQAGESKGLWFVVVLVLQFFGTLGYFFFVRDKLRRVEQSQGTPSGSSSGQAPR